MACACGVLVEYGFEVASGEVTHMGRCVNTPFTPSLPPSSTHWLPRALAPSFPHTLPHSTLLPHLSPKLWTLAFLVGQLLSGHLALKTYLVKLGKGGGGHYYAATSLPCTVDTFFPVGLLISGYWTPETQWLKWHIPQTHNPGNFDGNYHFTGKFLDLSNGVHDCKNIIW